MASDTTCTWAQNFPHFAQKDFLSQYFFLVPADDRSTPHKLPMVMRDQLVHVLPVWHLRLEICSHDSHSLVTLPMGYLGATTSGYTVACNRGCVTYMHMYTYIWGLCIQDIHNAVLGSLEDFSMYTHNEHVGIIPTQRLTL